VPEEPELRGHLVAGLASGAKHPHGAAHRQGEEDGADDGEGLVEGQARAPRERLGDPLAHVSAPTDEAGLPELRCIHASSVPAGAGAESS
jgi:hypothetical protein